MAQKEPIKNFVLHDRHGHEIDFSSFSVVSDVSVTFHAGVGEPYCESRYQGGILYLDFFNIKGEGITGITYDESQEDAGTNYLHATTDGGNEYDFPVKNGSRGNGITSIDTVESQEDDDYNVVRIHCTDDESEEGTVLRIKNGKRGNGIASVTEEMSDQDGGINTHTITDDDGRTHTIHTRNGRTGPQGDSAIWDENEPHEKLTDLAHTLGTSTVKPMSQKGIKDAFDAQFGHAEADLSISDEDGNNLVEFGEGHVKTKNFDSSNIGTINLSEDVKDGIFREKTAHSQADLDVSDEEGYIIMRLQGGHVKTKKFDSSKLAQNEVSLSGIYSRENPFGTDAEIIYKDAAMRMLPANVVPLIIIAGQSNADGRAPYTTAVDFPETEWLAEAEYQVQDYYMWDSAKSGFETYNVLTNNGAGTDEGSDGSGKNNYAFDPFFAKAFIDHYGKPIYAIRQTLGGVGIYDTVKRPSPLQSTWNAKIGYFEKQGVENVNYLLLNLISKIKDAQDWAAKNNKILLPVAILWHQGEHDANATAIPQYKQNLSEVISFMRGIFHAPALPFICGYISDSYNEYCPQINAVFEEMAEEDTYMKVVDMEGHYTFKDTNLHYDGQALAYMGEQMFDYYLQLNSLI